MKRLFGVAPPVAASGPAPTLSDASTRLNSQVQDIEANISRCDEELRKCLQPGPGGRSAAGKQKAVNALKRKKMYEQQRDQLLGTQFNVDNLAFQTEQAEVTMM